MIILFWPDLLLSNPAHAQSLPASWLAALRYHCVTTARRVVRCLWSKTSIYP
jgi:hypothetical protein